MADSFNPRTETSFRESEFDKVIRPQNFEQFSGQEKVLENLKVFVKAALLRGEALDHVLFHGPRAWARPRWPISSLRNWVST